MSPGIISGKEGTLALSRIAAASCTRRQRVSRKRSPPEPAFRGLGGRESVCMFRERDLFVRAPPADQVGAPEEDGMVKTLWASSRSIMKSPPRASPRSLSFSRISFADASSSTCSVTNHWRKMFVA